MRSDAVNKMAAWLSHAEKGVVFTGAGISTESGIPDFRSPGGIWSKYRTIYYDEFMASADARYEYWCQKSEAHRGFSDALPNAGHRVIAEWEAAQRIRGVVTQNIDGLHQLAGSRNVLELHGTARQVCCQDCGALYDAEPLVNAFLEKKRVPACRECEGGRLKHATVSFGQALPSQVLQQAAQWCTTADLLFAIGSSLVVSPAADLPCLAKQHGARLVIVNRVATPLDSIADEVVHEPIGTTLKAINQVLAKSE